MNLEEYKKIKDYSYSSYCDYLQNKYGIGLSDYMTKNWNKNAKCARTKEGLFAHHRYEDTAIMLCNKEFAMLHPFEWQTAKNIVYCDYLEHLFLHILICERFSENINEYNGVGIGGILNFLVPELNDFYSGWVTTQQWEINCHNLIRNDKEVYLTLLKRFKITCKNCPLYKESFLYTSLNESFGLWSKRNNKKIFEEIKKL